MMKVTQCLWFEKDMEADIAALEAAAKGQANYPARPASRTTSRNARKAGGTARWPG